MSAADANTWPFHRLLGATVGLFDPAIERENFLPDTSLIRRTRGEKPVDQQHLASPIATWADRTINLGVQSVTRLARFTIWPALALPQWSSFLKKKAEWMSLLGRSAELLKISKDRPSVCPASLWGEIMLLVHNTTSSRPAYSIIRKKKLKVERPPLHPLRVRL